MQKIIQYKTIISEIKKLKFEELKQFSDKTQLANSSWDKKKTHNILYILSVTKEIDE